jgi:predicted phage terminase large subunit-like protein
MQRLHENDIVGYLLSQRDKYFKAKEEAERLGLGVTSDTSLDEDDIDWDHLCLPAEYNPKHRLPSHTKLKFQDPRVVPGDALWPAGLPKSKIAALRIELGSYAASGQLDQLPSPTGGGMLKRDWFRKVAPEAWPPAFDKLVQSWDLSYSDDPTADYTVGWIIGRVGKKIYLWKRIRRQLSFNDQLTAVRALTEAVPEAKAKYVEKAANARALQNTLEAEIPGIILVVASESKVKRAMAWSPYLEAGNIHVPEGEPWLEEFFAECDAFPNGANDDQVDAAGLGITELLQKPTYNIRPDEQAGTRERWDY